MLLDIPAAGAATSSLTTPLKSTSQRPRTSFSFRPWVSGDGRFVAFDSDSAALVAGDTNRVRDIFIHDNGAHTVTQVSVGTGGQQPNGDSQRPTLSGDGRYVAFWSEADNLVEGDTNGVPDAFVYDRDTNVTRRVSVGPGGVQANGQSARPVISADGNLVAFESAASNLLETGVLGSSSDTNKANDVFVHDISRRETVRVSLASDGSQAVGDSERPSISPDGRFVAYQSEGALEPSDENQARDVYVRDLASGAMERVSLGWGGTEGDAGSFSPSLSHDGRYVAFWSNARNLVSDDTNGAADVFVRDRASGTTERVSLGSGGTEGDGNSSDPAISPDGRYVAFWSAATDLVADDTNDVRDVFLVDRTDHRVERVSLASDGDQGDGDSFSPNIGGGGHLVAFDSAATTLVTGDSNRGSDIFIHTSDNP